MNYLLPYIISAIIVFPISTMIIGAVIGVAVNSILVVLMRPLNPVMRVKFGGLITGIIDGLIMYFLTKTIFLILHQQLSIIIFLILIGEAFVVYIVDGWLRQGLIIEIFIFIGTIIGIFMFY